MKGSAWHIGRLVTLKECLTYISQENGGTAQHTGPQGAPGFGQEAEAGARGRPNGTASAGVSMGKAGRAAQDWLVRIVPADVGASGLSLVAWDLALGWFRAGEIYGTCESEISRGFRVWSLITGET